MWGVWTEEYVTGGGLRLKSQLCFVNCLIFSSASLHNIKIDVFHVVLMHRSVNWHKITHQANGHWILTCTFFFLFSILNLWLLSPISLISPSPPNKSLSSSYSSHMCCSASESLPWLSSKGSAFLSLWVYMYERANVLQATRLTPICR